MLNAGFRRKRALIAADAAGSGLRRTGINVASWVFTPISKCLSTLRWAILFDGVQESRIDDLTSYEACGPYGNAFSVGL